MPLMLIAAFVIVFLLLAVALVRTFDPGRSYVLQFVWSVDDLIFGPHGGKPSL